MFFVTGDRVGSEHFFGEGGVSTWLKGTSAVLKKWPGSFKCRFILTCHTIHKLTFVFYK